MFLAKENLFHLTSPSQQWEPIKNAHFDGYEFGGFPLTPSIRHHQSDPFSQCQPHTHINVAFVLKRESISPFRFFLLRYHCLFAQESIAAPLSSNFTQDHSYHKGYSSFLTETLFNLKTVMFFSKLVKLTGKPIQIHEDTVSLVRDYVWDALYCTWTKRTPLKTLCTLCAKFTGSVFSSNRRK